MRKDRVPLPTNVWAVVVFCLAALSVASSQTRPPSRILHGIGSEKMVMLKGNVSPRARPQNDKGALSSDMQLHGVTLVFNHSAAQQAAMDQLLQEQRDPASPNYRKWLTPDEYAARFGMNQDDLDKVTAWLQAQGFTGIRASRGRTEISFDGTAGQIESAFRLQMHQYLVNGKMHFANATEPVPPGRARQCDSGHAPPQRFPPQGALAEDRAALYLFSVGKPFPGARRSGYHLQPGASLQRRLRRLWPKHCRGGADAH